MADTTNYKILSNTRYEILTKEGFKDFKGLIIGENPEKIQVNINGNILHCTPKHKFDIDGVKIYANELKVGENNVTSINKYTNNKKVYEILHVVDIHGYICNNINVFQCLILDEFAFVAPNIAMDFWASVYPVISRRKNHKVIIVSTPYGAQGLFYETYQRALLGIDEDGWKPFEIKWQDVPGRDEVWRKKILAGMNGDKRQFAQEFGNCFHGSSYTLIPGDVLQKYKKYGELINIKEPLLEDVDINGLYKLKIWKQPKKNKTYIIGADTGEGIGKDFSIILVFDITNTSNIEQVASFADNSIGLTEFAYVLAKVGTKYNNAYIAMENNGISKTSVENLHIIFEYENIINYGTKDISRIGIHSHNSIKFNACVWLKDMFNYKDINIVINDTNLIYEMGWFERKISSPQPIFTAVSGKRDDYMLAFIWAMYCIHSGIVENYFIVDNYFLTNEGIEIPQTIKNYNDKYYDDAFMGYDDLYTDDMNDADKLDRTYRNLRSGIDNVENSSSDIDTKYDDNLWVNL